MDQDNEQAIYNRINIKYIQINVNIIIKIFLNLHSSTLAATDEMKIKATMKLIHQINKVIF